MGSGTKWEGNGKWKLEQKKKGSGNRVIREGKWNRKVGTARWDGGASKRDWPVETGITERKWNRKVGTARWDGSAGKRS